MFNHQEGMLRKTKQEFVRERLERNIAKQENLITQMRFVLETLESDKKVMERELSRWQ